MTDHVYTIMVCPYCMTQAHRCTDLQEGHDDWYEAPCKHYSGSSQSYPDPQQITLTEEQLLKALQLSDEQTAYVQALANSLGSTPGTSI